MITAHPLTARLTSQARLLSGIRRELAAALADEYAISADDVDSLVATIRHTNHALAALQRVLEVPIP